MEFFQALASYGFMKNALLAGTLASIACGITGSFVIIKRLTFISGGIAHTALGGIGVAYFLGVDLIAGSIVSALLSAVVIGLVTIKSNEHTDTVIGALWAVGMAIGIIFLSMTPGYNVSVVSYLFGNILMVSGGDLLKLFLLDLCIIIIVFIFYRQFIWISFDEAYSKIRGIWVKSVYILLLCLIALTVVVLINVVGLILVIALLTIPSAISRIFTGNIRNMIFISAGIGLVFTFLGLAVSYGPNLPAGPTIILISGLFYLLTVRIRRIY